MSFVKPGGFPSPLEVDRFLYFQLASPFIGLSTAFPSPLEVDRFLYLATLFPKVKQKHVSVPSRGR